jgi:hypothetical protein
MGFGSSFWPRRRLLFSNPEPYISQILNAQHLTLSPTNPKHPKPYKFPPLHNGPSTLRTSNRTHLILNPTNPPSLTMHQVAKLREQKRELEKTLRKQAEELAAEKAVTKQVGSLEP